MLCEALLMSTHNICFCEELEKVIPEFKSSGRLMLLQTKPVLSKHQREIRLHILQK